MFGASVGTAIGFVTASMVSFLDWRHNPGRIFHSDGQTHWKVVWDTWLSWFIPVSILACSVVIVVRLWISRRL